jgi:hypothetical protein
MGHEGTARSLFDLGEYEQTRAMMPDGIACCRELGDRRKLCTSLLAFGNAALKLGLTEQARAPYAEALLLARDLSDMMLTGLSFGSFAALSAAEGQPAKALCQGSAAFRLVGGMGSIIPEGPRVWLEDEMRAAREVLDAPTAEAAWEAGQTMPLELLTAEALTEDNAEP